MQQTLLDASMWHARQVCIHVVQCMNRGGHLDKRRVRSFLTVLAQQRTMSLLMAHEPHLSDNTVMHALKLVRCKLCAFAWQT